MQKQRKAIGKSGYSDNQNKKQGGNMIKSEDEIYEVEAKAAKSAETGTNWAGMSYEEGILSTINWLLNGGPDPMDDD